MKNSIWVGRNSIGVVIVSFEKIKLNEAGHFTGTNKPTYAHCGDNIFGLRLEKCEILELIYDTETGKVEVKRPREIGWYLAECKSVEDDGLIFACHWNGENWNPVRNKAKWRLGVTWEGLDENEVTVISEKLPNNEYLRSLE